MIQHVKLVTVPTRDQDRALAFWTQKVGLRVVTDQPFDGTQRWIELRIGTSPTRLVLFTQPGQEARIGSPWPGALGCDDLEATHRELAARGVVFDTPPTTAPWGSYAVFRDPDGNTFVLSSS